MKVKRNETKRNVTSPSTKLFGDEVRREEGSLNTIARNEIQYSVRGYVYVGGPSFGIFVPLRLASWHLHEYRYSINHRSLTNNAADKPKP